MSLFKTRDEPEEERALALVDGPEPLLFRVSDLKQWFVCPRIVYYQHLHPTLRPTTYAMRAGQEAHEAVRPLEQRRTLHVYGIPDGVRHFDVPLYAPDLGLTGMVDLLIEREEELIPVDFKDSTQLKAKQFMMQVVAYGLLLEHLWERPVRRGFVYSLPRRQVHEVKLTPQRRRAVQQALAAMRQMAQTALFPPPPSTLRLCPACEFRRFCNDVL